MTVAVLKINHVRARTGEDISVPETDSMTERTGSALLPWFQRNGHVFSVDLLTIAGRLLPYLSR